jgi:hypothetical protein
MVVKVQDEAFSHVMLYSVVVGYHHIGGPCYLQLQEC